MPRIILMSDDRRLPDPTGALGNLRPGDGLILRHRDDAERRRLATALRPLCLRLKVFLIIAADSRLAMEVNADGIHLSEAGVARSAISTYWARQRGMIVTAAAHSASALKRAEAAGVDGALISPVCATASHPDKRALGILRFTGMRRSTPLQVYGLGGIDRRNIMRLSHTGASGIAGIGVIANSAPS
jgi:thiamine-phosphate pyrophosphorylase